jgi:colanic acid biosynthesis glycosyl transferase WcaI
MLQRLREKGVEQGKLTLIPNFVDVQGFAPLPKDNAFSRKHGLYDKFVVSYAGNVGKPQQLDVLIGAAALLRSVPRIHFLFMGSGTEWDHLQRLTAEHRLSNVTFLPHQPYTVMPLAYASTDVSYVPQAIGTSNDGIPSKVYRIFAASRAVLASTDSQSDLAALIEEAAAGVIVTIAEPELIAEAIRKASADPIAWARLGANGRDHVVNHYDRAVVSRKYDQLISEICRKAREEAM